MQPTLGHTSHERLTGSVDGRHYQQTVQIKEGVVTDSTEHGLDALFKRLKKNDPDWETKVERGTLLLTKKWEDLTESERAFLEGNSEKLN